MANGKTDTEKKSQRPDDPSRLGKGNEENSETKGAAEHRPALSLKVAKISKKKCPTKSAGTSDAHHPRKSTGAEVKNIPGKHWDHSYVSSTEQTINSGTR